ncbi:MAG TPA: excinuclease ABC subunit UvrC [Candidatus Limivicinus faecipullorum]|nr:excinuclease ABC subunit UvrC [Candidatus Limivicinus faecipullorum]
MMLDTLREKANNLPLLPGVYIMLDEKSQVIYVGKAKKLKNRVSSYFHGEHLPKVQAMVDKVADFNVIVAGSEFEALVLENSLIKRHKPHYNILLKDDKGYPFIRMDLREEYPVMSLSNKALKDGAKYFGPFGGRSQSRNVISTISKALLLPDCSRKFPRDIGKERPCLNYHMGSCLGWCLKDSDGEDYRRRARQAAQILEGKGGELMEELRTQMEQAAEELRFEKAAELRDRLRAVENLSNRQRVIATAFADTDAIGFCRGAKSCFTVLHFVNGDLVGKDTEMMDEPLEEDGEAISDLVRQYYTAHRGGWPKSILLPCKIDDREELEELLSQCSGRRIYIETPQRGERMRLIESAALNAREEIQRRTTVAQRRSKTLEWLQKTLGLDEFPERIEAFDISNLGSTGIVAAMTVHVDGKPLKKAYRKFRIRDLEMQDDYASMYQAVYRRFKHYVEGDEHFSPLPELLLIDGGDTHAAVAVQAQRDLGLFVPTFGMVKDDRHRTRALISPEGREIGISQNQAVFALIGGIQEETHRFAIEYQRSLRSESYGSTLDKIPGVGEKRRSELIKYFKSVKAIREASLEQLKLVVPRNTAQAVYDYFHSGEETDK